MIRVLYSAQFLCGFLFVLTKCALQSCSQISELEADSVPTTQRDSLFFILESILGFFYGSEHQCQQSWNHSVFSSICISEGNYILRLQCAAAIWILCSPILHFVGVAASALGSLNQHAAWLHLPWCLQTASVGTDGDEQSSCGP